MAFIWYELITPDPVAAGEFYKAVTGVTFGERMPDMDYRLIFRDDGGNLGGVLLLNDEMREGCMTPRWMPYLHVANVDESLAAIKAEGGEEYMPPTDIPGVGRIAMLADPQGVPIYIMTPTPPPGMEKTASDVFDPAKPQHVRWNELASPNQDRSLAFYSKYFGFEFNERMPMGEFGDYCFISYEGRTLGAIMKRMSPEQPALWLMYIGVPSIMAAKEKVEANGGMIHMGPHEVPGGDWIIVGTDPQGAGFGLVGPKGE